MTIRVVAEDSRSAIVEYSRIPIAFQARTRLDVRALDNRSFSLAERSRAEPFHKDYDALESPTSWPDRFDVSRWTFFGAYDGHTRVGGAIVIMRSPEIDLLEGRDDLAVLWDIRVAPHVRGKGVGTALLSAVERWAANNGAVQLKVETQDVNPAACRFYERHGFVLRAVERQAYRELPDETQLLWYKDLSKG